MNALDWTTYVLDPLAPIIVRSGRPFDGQTGADSARFPPPSTLAGALRTAHAESAGLPLGEHLLQLPIEGPLPVRLDAHGQPLSLLVPKPADAHYFHGDRLVASRPHPLSAGEGMDLPDGALLPVQLAEAVTGKPVAGPPWWSLDDLGKFRRGEPLRIDALKANGWQPPDDDVRTHVAIEPGRQAAASGQLFQTAGISFVQRVDAKVPKTDLGTAPLPTDRIGIVGRLAGKIAPGVVPLGGERRLAAIAPCAGSLWRACPDDFVASLRRARGVCLTLLTPALFEAGWRPAASLPGCDGVRLQLRAAALERWQPHSGWDLARNAPRAGRKLVPPGAVYWFDILNAADAPESALHALWFATISDHAQDRRDGFGLVHAVAWTPPASS